ncbi:MAG TPA: BlaI/MecI/CopY family transcriptional regulator [Candidatus Acidoferrales bacterium]|nr:BlaI/MecI/CopY family transcriptional regulator [Candidatus Acidoferrales bacterium]
MKANRVTRFELQLLEKLWELGPVSVREIQESLPEADRPAYTTVQTMIYRLERKGAVKRLKKIGNAHVFEAVLTRIAVRKRIVADLLDMFGGSPASVMSHLVDAGQLTLADIKMIERELAKRETKK